VGDSSCPFLPSPKAQRSRAGDGSGPSSGVEEDGLAEGLAKAWGIPTMGAAARAHRC